MSARQAASRCPRVVPTERSPRPQRHPLRGKRRRARTWRPVWPWAAAQRPAPGSGGALPRDRPAVLHGGSETAGRRLAVAHGRQALGFRQGPVHRTGFVARSVAAGPRRLDPAPQRPRFPSGMRPGRWFHRNRDGAVVVMLALWLRFLPAQPGGPHKNRDRADQQDDADDDRGLVEGLPPGGSVAGNGKRKSDNCASPRRSRSRRSRAAPSFPVSSALQVLFRVVRRNECSILPFCSAGRGG